MSPGRYCAYRPGGELEGAVAVDTYMATAVPIGLPANVGPVLGLITTPAAFEAQTPR